MAIIYNSSKDADAVATEIASTNNVTVRAYQANVANQDSIDAAVRKIAKDFGKLDIIVVNSGVASCVAAEEYTTQQWKQIMDVNLDGAFYTAQAAAKIFKEQGHGNVVFTASVSATLVNVPQKQAAVWNPSILFEYKADHIEVQRLQSRGRTARKVPISGMGRLLSSKLYFTRLHRH